MARQSIPLDDLRARTHHLWLKQWLLLTAGDFAQADFNSMTVGWGSLGTMWNKPFAQIVVRPTRHTYGFLERYDSFTLCAFTSDQRPALQIMGTESGRDGDKVAKTGLTPIASTLIAAPAYDEAELILECRTLYSQDMDPARFMDAAIERNYPEKDYHRIYYGEIVAALGGAKFGAAAL